MASNASAHACKENVLAARADCLRGSCRVVIFVTPAHAHRDPDRDDRARQLRRKWWQLADKPKPCCAIVESSSRTNRSPDRTGDLRRDAAHAGGLSDGLPASGHEFVSTTHLKNTDIDRDVIASAPQFELCTDDWNQALGWSETSAVNAPQYADLVETNDDSRYFEFGRVRQGTPQLYQRARVFNCAYLNRATANLRAANGAAGQLNRRPLTGAELRAISEYLWQFTTYNNFGHVVLKSANTDSATLVQHTLLRGFQNDDPARR